MSIYICWDEIIETRAQTNPNIVEENYVATVPLDNSCPSILIDKNFDFIFTVDSLTKSDYSIIELDETYFTPQLILANQTLDDVKLVTYFTLESARKIGYDSDIFYIKNLNQIPEEKRRITICSNYSTIFSLKLFPCVNDTYNQNICKPQNEIDKALKTVGVVIHNKTDVNNYESGFRGYLSAYEYLIKQGYYTNNFLRTEAITYFEHIDATVNNPFKLFDSLMGKKI